jgi:hypothetical protein
MVSGCLLVSKNQDMNQFAMGQVFCWSARVMCLGTTPLPIQASRIGLASSPRVRFIFLRRPLA